MARIGEMPSTDDISATGYVIYTKDGVHANKITVEDFANALDILMTGSGGASGGGGEGGGLKYWKEYQDSAGNSFLLAQDPSERLLYPSTETLTADNWTSLYQYDNWQSQEPIPNLPGTVENKTDDLGGTIYYPYILFAMLHPVGSDLSDFTHVENDIYKIETSTIGKFRLSLFYLRPKSGEDGVYIWNTDPDFATAPADVPFSNDCSYAIYYSNLNCLAINYIGCLFENQEEASDYLDNTFLSSGTGMGVGIAGYFKWKYVIDNIYEYLVDTEYGDEDEYTYIEFIPDSCEIHYSSDGVNYISYTEVDTTVDPPHPTSKEWANLFLDILNVVKVGDYTAISNKGIYFGIPFSREQYNETTGKLDLAEAKAIYGPNGIWIKDYANSASEAGDIIYLDYTVPTSGGYAEIVNRYYKQYVADYVRSQLGSITYLTNISINNLSIVDTTTQEAKLYTGQGLTFDPNTGQLSVNTSQLQPQLQPGSGVEIENNTISFTGQVQDVLVDYQSVVNENGTAEIWLPSGIKETRLQDGNHTEIEDYYDGDGYSIKKIHIVDVKNAITVEEDDSEFGDISTGTYTDNTVQTVVSITIPAGSNGMLYGSAIMNSNLISGDGYFASMLVNDDLTWPNTDSDAFYSPMYDSRPVMKPYQESGVNVYTQTVLKTASYISNNTDNDKTYNMHVKIHADKASTVHGKLTYVQNIDI